MTRDRSLFSIVLLLLATAAGWSAATGCLDSTSPAATTSSETPVRVDKTASSATSGVESAATSSVSENGASDAPRQQALRDISFDTIKFDMPKDAAFKRTMITPAIEKMGNTKIRIRG